MKTYEVAGKPIRGYEQGGELWFIGKDVSVALGTNPSNQQWGIEDHEYGSTIVATKGGPQPVKTVSASGLISLVFRSKRPEALELRKWAYSLVVPYLRMRISEVVLAGVDPREEREARRSALRAIR
jgi:prophage antirepressor-like protein